VVEEDIVGAVGPLVQGHIYPLRRPQLAQRTDAETLPVVVYTLVGDDWMTANTFCGFGLHFMRIQLDVYHQHMKQCRDLAYQVADAMGTLGTLLSLQPFPNDDERIARWLIEFSVGRNERPEVSP
jgi:hypothetical protein